jgi:hypothetical protein
VVGVARDRLVVARRHDGRVRGDTILARRPRLDCGIGGDSARGAGRFARRLGGAFGERRELADDAARSSA